MRSLLYILMIPRISVSRVQYFNQNCEKKTFILQYALKSHAQEIDYYFKVEKQKLRKKWKERVAQLIELTYETMCKTNGIPQNQLLGCNWKTDQV